MGDKIPESRPVLYLATRNEHKVAEFAAALGPSTLTGSLPYVVRSVRDLAPDLRWNEDGQTFEANARIKAQAVRGVTDEAVLADDSGLCVDALGGAPGIHSSRYGGVDGDHAANNAKLLEALADVPAEQRRAHFVCVLWYIDKAGHEFAFRGECHGRLLDAPRGTGGFGYDPLFVMDGIEVPFSDLAMEAKNQYSHRARALDLWLRHVGAGVSKS